MVEDRLIENVGRDYSKDYFDLSYKTFVRYVPLDKIKLNKEKRVRMESGDYKFNPKYSGIKESMRKLRNFNPITLKQIDGDYKLLAGFIRLCVAIELGWLTIESKIFPNTISKYDELLIELIENLARIDFTSYEVYVGIGRAKVLYEKEHPDTLRGKYIRNTSKNQDRKSITATNAVMISSNGGSDSFVKIHSKLFGMSERTMYNKTRIAEAILENKFNTKTIKKLKQGKKTQAQLLQLLKNIERKYISNFQMHKSLPVSKETQAKPTKKNHYSNKGKSDSTNKLTYSQLEELERVIEASKKYALIKEKLEDFKNGKMSLVELIEITEKVILTHTKINEQIINKLRETEAKSLKSSVKDGSRELKGLSSHKVNSSASQDKCQYCKKATVFAVTCGECGHRTARVLCDDDFINNEKRLLDPNFKKCINSSQ